MSERWGQRQARLPANTVVQFNVEGQANAVAVRVLNDAIPVFMSLDPNLNLLNFESRADPLSFGVLSRFQEIKTFFLFSANAVDIMIVEIYSENVTPLLQSAMVKTNVANAVTVTGTVGVTPGDLNLDGARNAGIVVQNDNRQRWSVLGTSATNTIISINRAGIAGQSHFITGYLVVLTGAAAANDTPIRVLEGTTIRIQDFIGGGAARGTRIFIDFPIPYRFAANTAATLDAGAAGAGAIVNLVLFGYTI